MCAFIIRVFFRFVLFIAFENLCKYFFKSFLYYDKRYWEINKSQILIVAWAVNENKKTTQTNFITKYLQRDANNVFVRNEIFPWEDFFSLLFGSVLPCRKYIVVAFFWIGRHRFRYRFWPCKSPINARIVLWMLGSHINSICEWRRRLSAYFLIMQPGS